MPKKFFADLYFSGLNLRNHIIKYQRIPNIGIEK